jgi:hypothetical protein
MRALLALVVALVAGCYHDKYHLAGPKKEECVLPPDQPRYNLPETATWRAPPPPKEQDTLLNRGGNTPGGGGAPGKLGGF